MLVKRVYCDGWRGKLARSRNPQPNEKTNIERLKIENARLDGRAFNKEKQMTITPYLHFDGKCAEAIEFYKKTLGAQVEVVMRFKDSPMPNDPNKVKPEMMNQVMHSSFKIGDTTILASDCGKPMQGFSLTLNLTAVDEVDRLFKALSDGGQVFQQPIDTFYAKRFAIANDRYGVNWILIVPQPMTESAKHEHGTLASV